MASRKKNKKRDKKKRRPPVHARHIPPGLPENVVVIQDPPGQVKMSAVLMEFIEPYSHLWNTEDQLNKLLAVALIAWNAAIVTGRERDKFIEDMLNTVPLSVRPGMRAIVAEMLQRKLTHFAGNRRMILSHEVTMLPTGPYVSVVSSLETA